MKKKILAILLSVVLVLGAVAVLAACKPDGPTPGEVPTEEGKVTFYCTIEGYEVPEYASPFLQGPYTSGGKWQPGEEMKNVEGTNIWYAIIDITPEELLANYNDETKDEGKWSNYMVDLGYNAKSGLPEDKQGERGSYLKSDETAAPGGTDNPSYEYTGGNTVNLGTQHFTLNPIAPPVRISTDATVQFTEALGANAEVQIRGGFNNWGNDGVEAKATPGADRKTWSLHLDGLIVSSYEFKVLVCTDTTQIKQDEHKDDAWNATLEDGKTKAYIEVNYGGGNINYAFKNRDNGSPAYILGDAVLDLSTAVEKPNDDNTVINRQIDLQDSIEITFSVSFKEALPDGYTVWIGGNGPFGGSDWNKELFPQMTSTDRKTWTVTLNVDKALIGTEIECKVCAQQTTAFDWDVGYNWGENGEEHAGGNYKFTLAEGKTAYTLFENLELPAATAE